MMKRATGFTLMELLIVVAIIIALASITIPAFLAVQKRQGQTSCINNLRQIGVALAMYHEDHGKYPASPDAAYLKAWRPRQDGSLSADTLAHMPFASVPPPLIGGTGPNAGNPATDITVSGSHTADPPRRYWVRIADDTADPNTAQTSSDGVTWSAPVPIATRQVDGSGNVTYTPLDLSMPSGQLKCKYTQPTGNTAGDIRVIWDVKATGNFGLYALYYLYLKDKKDYLRGYRQYHCPTMRDTEAVNRDEYRRLLDADRTTAVEWRVDPLMGGFSTYEAMYNGSQYDEAIANFDIALSGQKSADPNSPDFFTPKNALHSPRQLQFAHPPTDTVVTVCFAHRPSPGPTFHASATRDIDPVTLASRLMLKPALTFRPGTPPADIARQQREAETAARGDMDIVLWLDGSVDLARPRLVRGADDPTTNEQLYYWQPPFLYTRGGRE